MGMNISAIETHHKVIKVFLQKFRGGFASP
jgi:hypothetical protein